MFMQEHLISSPWVASKREVVPPKRLCKAAYGISHQLFSVNQITVLPHAPYSPDATLQFFPLIPTTELRTERSRLRWHSGHSDNPDKKAMQRSRKCFPVPLQRPPEILQVVSWHRRKLFWRRSLVPECKHTVLIFIRPFLELSGHRLYFIHN